MADCDRDIFAAFTGPDGGITSIANTAEQGRKPDSLALFMHMVGVAQHLGDYSLRNIY